MSPRSAVSLIQEAWRDALAVLFPVECAGCFAHDRALCDDCRALLEMACCGPFSEQNLDDSTRVVSALHYEGRVRRMILSLKEQGRTDVVRALARPLRAAIEQSVIAFAPGGLPRVELCAVPASPASTRRRGYRPVELLVRAAGYRLAPVLSTVAPKNGGATQEQKSLDVTQRGENRRGSLYASVSARGRSFVIVDDVVTSGATLTEAVRALRAGGAEVVVAVTLAFTPKRNAQKVPSQSSRVTSTGMAATVAKRGAITPPGFTGRLASEKTGRTSWKFPSTVWVSGSPTGSATTRSRSQKKFHTSPIRPWHSR